jgi:hypothetical protein
MSSNSEQATGETVQIQTNFISIGPRLIKLLVIILYIIEPQKAD